MSTLGKCDKTSHMNHYKRHIQSADCWNWRPLDPPGEAPICPKCGSQPFNSQSCSRCGYGSVPSTPAGETRRETKESFLSRWPEHEKGWTNRAMTAYNATTELGTCHYETHDDIHERNTRCIGFRAVPAAPAGETRQHNADCCLDLDHKGDCKRWMKLPPNSAYPDFKELHVEDDWCPKAGCVPASKCDIEMRNGAGQAPADPSSVSESGGQPALTPDLVVRCSKCKGTLIYRRHESKYEVEVFSCGCYRAASQPSSPVTAENRHKDDFYNNSAAIRAQGQRQPEEYFKIRLTQYHEIQRLTHEIEQMKRELTESIKAHEAIGDILLPLVGTPDGTSLGAARNAAKRLREMEEGLRQLVESARNGNELGQTWYMVAGGLIDEADRLLKGGKEA